MWVTNCLHFQEQADGSKNAALESPVEKDRISRQPSHPHLHFFSQFSTPCTFTMRQSGCLCSKTHSNWQLWIKEHWKH